MALEDATLAEPSPLDTDEIPVVVVAPESRPVWWRTWALGDVALALAIFMAVSGLGLTFHYRPLVATAYFDLVDLAEESRFGFVRELHRWGSHVLLIVLALHLFRVVVTGAYHPPRRLNYHVGVVLGLLVVCSAITGHLLPWDQHARWLIQLLAEHGMPPDDGSLAMIYALHCGLLPVGATLLAVDHVRRARRAVASRSALSGNEGPSREGPPAGASK